MSLTSLLYCKLAIKTVKRVGLVYFYTNKSDILKWTSREKIVNETDCLNDIILEKELNSDQMNNSVFSLG